MGDYRTKGDIASKARGRAIVQQALRRCLKQGRGKQTSHAPVVQVVSCLVPEKHAIHRDAFRCPKYYPKRGQKALNRGILGVLAEVCSSFCLHEC